MNKNNGMPMPAVFSFGDRIPLTTPPYFREALQDVWLDTPLSEAFFSDKNIAAIQKGIQEGVYQLSKKQFRLGMKNNERLKKIMRNIFIVHSKHTTDNIKTQLQALNNLVLRETVQEVYSEAEGYIKYERDRTQIAIPLPPPMMTKTDHKQLIFKDRY